MKEQQALFDFILNFEFDRDVTSQELYYYRSGSSLISILGKENVGLRLTLAEQFDDKLEGKAVELYYDVALENLLNAGKIDRDQYEELIQIDMPNQIQIIYEKEDGTQMIKDKVFDAYIVCFSTKKDDPYMYNNYVHDKNSGGFCIEFFGGELESLSQIGVENEATIKLIPVMYGIQAIHFVEKQVLRIVQDPYLYVNKDTVIGMVLQYVQFSAKRSRYMKENEMRLVVYLAKDNVNDHPNICREHNKNGELDKNHMLFYIPKEMVSSVSVDSKNSIAITERMIKHIKALGYCISDL